MPTFGTVSWFTGLVLALSFSLPAAAGEPVPDDFPEFIVPGHEHEMDDLRRLMWHHYPVGGPKATLWDEWLSTPSLWPAVDTDNLWRTMREQWRTTLAGRIMDPEGYVATHQHVSIAHQLGWPFPFWAQGKGGWGWHFSLENVMPGWHGTEEKTQEGWTLENGADDGIHDHAWNLKLDARCGAVTAPPLSIDPFNAPFLQLRWRAKGLGNARPFVEWATKDHPAFVPERRFYFPPIESDQVQYTMIPVYRHPEWKGEITRLRIQFANERPGATVGIQAFFTNYDTRHNINNQNFVRGCANYFQWTGDINFLRGQINRMRTAMRYIMKEFHADRENLVLTTWVGHEGRSGIAYVDGQKVIRSGEGIGNNYWDLLPMGYQDCYATIQYYDALKSTAEIERAVASHPEWDVPGGVLAFTPDELADRAARVKDTGNRVFWNEKTGRFYCAIDADGVGHDYGFTFLNLEAIYYDFASPEHAESIMDWICGDRTVEGDTSTGADIYHWRFGPRSTTKRNTDYYFWAWSSPESIPWGGQVQDGGAVMGFSYYDLMARLKVRGPDSVAERLAEITKWYDDVEAAGGYRAYYETHDGTMQGGGTAGGLGLDMEFFESLLLPQIMFDGFLGFAPDARGFTINPVLPRDWPELTITQIRFQDVLLSIHAGPDSFEIRVHGSTGLPGEPPLVSVPAANWKPVNAANAEHADGSWTVPLPRSAGATLRFRRP